jgi:AcrR family transcriptional regulator
VPATTLWPLPATAAQWRIVGAARVLFARHGIGGTSLQMIADELGVTKAAVYHQYRTKDEIVLSVAGASLLPLEQALDAAAAAPDRSTADDLLIERFVDTAIMRREHAETLQNDPVMARFVAQHPPFRALMERFFAALVTEPGDDARVRATVVAAGVNGAVIHPLVADLDDDELRVRLVRLARELLSGRAAAGRLP